LVHGLSVFPGPGPAPRQTSWRSQAGEAPQRRSTRARSGSQASPLTLDFSYRILRESSIENGKPFDPYFVFVRIS
jgi:hypothetical protein